MYNSSKTLSLTGLLILPVRVAVPWAQEDEKALKQSTKDSTAEVNNLWEVKGILNNIEKIKYVIQ
ncbi:hypothetical protein GCM10011405_40470 [Rufibacter glacialis]|nr:hypothetical protein GCM10011405_40470 [Rufibacter glacialis]